MNAGFDITTQCPPDVMHDELEGSLKEHLSLIVRHLIQSKLLPRAVINRRLYELRHHNANQSKLDLPDISERDAERLAAGDLLGRRGTRGLIFEVTVPF